MIAIGSGTESKLLKMAQLRRSSRRFPGACDLNIGGKEERIPVKINPSDSKGVHCVRFEVKSLIVRFEREPQRMSRSIDCRLRLFREVPTGHIAVPRLLPVNEFARGHFVASRFA